MKGGTSHKFNRSPFLKLFLENVAKQSFSAPIYKYALLIDLKKIYGLIKCVKTLSNTFLTVTIITAQFAMSDYHFFLY